MLRSILISSLLLFSSISYSQTTTTVPPINQGSYDSKTLVDTNSTSTSVSTVNTTSNTTSTSVNTNNSTVNSTNTNHNISSGNMTYNNNNINTSTNINKNENTGTMTYNNNNINTSVNTNNNVSSSTNVNQNIQSGSMTNLNKNDSTITQRSIQTPPTAIAPAMMSMGTDLCVTGVSGAAQTQILGISLGGTQRDYNCERLKLSKTLFDMGMKVAAVATMCQDRRVFDAMLQAGTPCPYEGLIGDQAKVAWDANPHKKPKPVKE